MQKLALFTVSTLFLAFSATAQRQMEYLNRGMVAVHQGNDSVYVGWRMLGTEPENIAFNLYRSTGKNAAVKLNEVPITATTDYLDTKVDLDHVNAYHVRPVINGKETTASEAFKLPANAKAEPYLTIPLKTPTGYTPGDLSVGDLDGDGTYELIVHQTGRARDNSHDGFSDPAIFQAYHLDGRLLWEINLGINIREGAHYTQFMVYDLDGDGLAEFACKTADGTKDGEGKIIGDPKKDWRNETGRILDGPEYFTIFNGKTGAAMATTGYIPGRGNLGGWGGVGGNGGNDQKGNRVDRFNAAIAYLDGERPSIVMCRGYYGRTVLAAWDWSDGKLTSRWIFDTKDSNNPYSGMGNHNLSVADVDGDGKDEIIYGAMCVDDNGKGLYTTGLRHGDALHVSDLDPRRPGLEVFGVHEIEESTKGPGVALFDAKTGEILFSAAHDTDVGRGVAANIDATREGAQLWWAGGDGLFDMKANKIGEQPSSTNFLVWWDGDLSRELLSGIQIDKYNGGRLLKAEGSVANNGSKSTPALSADILGDWREEVIFRTADNQALRIYTSTIPSQYKLYTLMHDPQYRLSIAWQNVGYNQPPHTGFYLGKGMKKAPRPAIKTTPHYSTTVINPLK
ncbi:rhamnogalacturonan endolyase [Pedobacter sp. CAN_A7]|uniref:rhamnogalacturonan lyase n=1 Tax=Pedobacter sp. CAN_A7 TaxID=2787722 RepID=UPI0018CBE88F